MTRVFAGAAAALTIAAALCLPQRTAAQTESPLAGVWTLNASQSEMPAEIGFDLPWMSSGGRGAQGGGGGTGGGGGRGRRGSTSSGGAAASPFTPRESYDDAKRLQLLTAEARKPPTRLMIVDAGSSITITNELGQSRVLHPTGREESLDAQGVPLIATTKREGDRLVVLYNVQPGRDIRYTYSRTTAPQLVVEVEFLERGAGEKARRVYDPGMAATQTTSAAAPSGGSTGGTAAPAGMPAQQSPESFDERPGAELRGLTSLGILVEDLSAQARSCGLDHDAIEAALAKRLTDGGFTVRRNSDEDTYLYVNVMTNTLSTGACASRYDVFLYTHATAKLSYGARPVLVQVSLMHRGGIGASAPTSHAAAVVRGLEGYVDLVVSQIREANK